MLLPALKLKVVGLARGYYVTVPNPNVQNAKVPNVKVPNRTTIVDPSKCQNVKGTMLKTAEH
jgi:hypothetical protein